MTLGNLIALQQRQVVRLFAYSSIAQSGYMLLPFALVGVTTQIDQAAFAAAVFYILVYAVMNLGAFGVLVAVGREAPGLLVRDFAGLSKPRAGRCGRDDPVPGLSRRHPVLRRGLLGQVLHLQRGRGRPNQPGWRS